MIKNGHCCEWSLEDMAPIHCFNFGLQNFMRLSFQLPSVRFTWYSRCESRQERFPRCSCSNHSSTRKPQTYWRRFICEDFFFPIAMLCRTHSPPSELCQWSFHQICLRW